MGTGEACCAKAITYNWFQHCTVICVKAQGLCDPVAGYGSSYRIAALNLIDAFGLLIARGTFVVGRRRPTERYTYGFGRATILTTLANGIALLIGVGAIVREAMERIASPESIAATTVLWVAAIGIAIKLGTVLLFSRGRS
jgi:hypothetical protein